MPQHVAQTQAEIPPQVQGGAWMLRVEDALVNLGAATT